MSTCKFCDAPINWSKDDGKWVAYNSDIGTVHKCELYKPKSKGKRIIEEEARKQKEREWRKP